MEDFTRENGFPKYRATRETKEITDQFYGPWEKCFPYPSLWTLGETCQFDYGLRLDNISIERDASGAVGRVTLIYNYGVTNGGAGSIDINTDNDDGTDAFGGKGYYELDCDCFEKPIEMSEDYRLHWKKTLVQIFNKSDDSFARGCRLTVAQFKAARHENELNDDGLRTVYDEIFDTLPAAQMSVSIYNKGMTDGTYKKITSYGLKVGISTYLQPTAKITETKYFSSLTKMLQCGKYLGFLIAPQVTFGISPSSDINWRIMSLSIAPSGQRLMMRRVYQYAHGFNILGQPQGWDTDLYKRVR